MQEKIEDIKRIQRSLWGMYKEFLEDKDPERYKARSCAFVDGQGGSLRFFCWDLVSTWIPMIDGLAEDFRNDREIKAKTDHIRYIQNTVWKMYEDFLQDHDMGRYNQEMGGLARRYHNGGDQQLLSFCQDMFISWSSVINALVQEVERCCHMMET